MGMGASKTCKAGGLSVDGSPETGRRCKLVNLSGFVFNNTGRSMAYFVYILGSDGKGGYRTYVGWTTDPVRRVGEHNSGKGARATRGRKWVLLYAERYATRGEAMRREWHLKRDRRFRKSLCTP